MIYFLQSLDGGPVKIGFTDSLEARRVALEKHYGCPLALLATMPGGRTEEAEIHERFREIRLGRTEQFRPTIELMTFIGRPLLVGANPDAVEAMPSVIVRDPSIKTVAVRATGEWAAWVERGAKHCRTDVAKMVDAAIVEYLKARKFEEQPPERIP